MIITPNDEICHAHSVKCSHKSYNKAADGRDQIQTSNTNKQYIEDLLTMRNYGREKKFFPESAHAQITKIAA
jgi:hypothetical protein